MKARRRNAEPTQEDILAIANDCALIERDYDKASDILDEGEPREIRIDVMRWRDTGDDETEPGWEERSAGGSCMVVVIGREIAFQAEENGSSRPVTDAIVQLVVEELVKRGATEYVDLGNYAAAPFLMDAPYRGDQQWTDTEWIQEDFVLVNFTELEQRLIFDQMRRIGAIEFYV